MRLGDPLENGLDAGFNHYLRYCLQRTAGRMSLTPEVIDAFSRTMRDKLETGDTQLRKAYLQSVISRIEVEDTNIRNMGNNRTLAAAVKANCGSKGSVR